MTSIDNRRARLRLELLDRRLQIRVRDVLDLAVDSQVHVFTIVRHDLLVHVLDNVTHPVLDHAAHARRSREHALVAELDAFLPLVLDIRKADQMRRDLAFRIKALVLAARIDTGDIERRHFLRDFDRHLAFHIDERLVHGQLRAQILRRHVEKCRQGR